MQHKAVIGTVGVILQLRCYVRGWMGLNWREERGAGCNRGELQGEVRDLVELASSETSPITERRQGKTERRDWETR